MPARTGQTYLTGLTERPREVWIDGGRVENVLTYLRAFYIYVQVKRDG
jgi:aromatic ring hydroxylase